MKFPYVELRERLLPIVPVEVNDIEFYAFVDSGASFSIFHSDIAEILDIKIEDGDKIFTARIGMSRKLGIGFDIIGRKDFFDNFKICFDEKNKIVEAIEY